MKKLALSILVLLLGPMSVAHAAQVSGKVTRIYISNGAVNFRLAGDCKASAYWQFLLSNSSAKAWYAMLLSAATNNKEVVISFDAACDPLQTQPINYIYQNF